MATKVVHVSDLSGREAEDEGQLGRLVVLELAETIRLADKYLTGWRPDRDED